MNPVILKFHKLLPLLPLIAGFSLIYIIQTHKLDSRARNSMLILLAAMNCWSLASFLLRNSDDPTLATIWVRFIRAAITVMCVSGLHFVYELLDLRKGRFVYISYAISLVIVVVALSTDLVIAPVGENVWGYYGRGGPLRPACSAFSFFLMFYSMALLFKYRYSRDRVLLREANITLIAFIVAFLGGMTDLLRTFGVPVYPSGMITHTVFVIMVAYGAFKHQLVGVLSRPQPRLVLAGLTYSLIASGMALTFTESTSKVVFTYLLGFLFLVFNTYHFFDDIAYLTRKYLRIPAESFLYKTVNHSSILFDDAEVGILALDRKKEILFANRKAACILGGEVVKNKSLSFLKNDILRRKLMKYSDHRREVVFDVDRETSAEVIPIELGGYVGTLVCFYPKAKRESLEKRDRTRRLKHLDFWDIFPED